MDPAVDPFQPLLRLIQRYKRDVHQLRAPATEEALTDAEEALSHELPLALKGFYKRWNGGSLFRDTLYLRATYELAPPSPDAPALVTIADDRAGRSWAYAPDGQGGWVFGEVRDGRLLAQHERYHRWLFGTLRVFDETLREVSEQLMARLECDPDSGYLLLEVGEYELAGGDPSRAAARFQKAVVAHPGLVRAWQRLGEMHLAEGRRDDARFALLKSVRATRLPPPYGGAPIVEPGTLRTLGGIFPAGDEGWEKELQRLIEERFRDVVNVEGLALYEAACLERHRVLMSRHDRRGARDAAIAGLERARAFTERGPLADLTLALVDVLTDLGEHDEAERALRRLRQRRSDIYVEERARAELACGRVVVMRQEPWAVEILTDVAPTLKNPADRARCYLRLGARYLQIHELDAARAAFDAAVLPARQDGNPALLGRINMGLGDLALASGDVEAADACWLAAREQGIAARDDQLLHRILVRRGDVKGRSGDLVAAAEDYRKAAEGYRQMQLPLREAWALVRLGQISADDAPAALRRAGELFRASGHAAGVAAVDEISGDTAASLEWHIASAAEHARSRYEARRSRPPLTRADADRPERRLVAHRVAISQGGEALIEALGTELERLARELESAKARSLDPNVTRFVAAADLMAYHRSYDAAQRLLKLLLERSLPDIPTRALKSGVTRSPNAALVSGLLEVVEKRTDARAVEVAAEILGWRREAAAVDALRALLRSDEFRQPVRRAVVVALGRIGDRGAVDDLLPEMDDPEIAEDVAIALLLLGDRRGVDFFGQALAAGGELAGPPGEIVGRYGGPAYLLLLMNTATESSTRALAAIQGLGFLGDPRAVSRLLDVVGTRDPQVAQVASSSLELLTGHRENHEEPGLQVRWIRWWEQNGQDFREGSRYRHGELVSPALLVKQLADDDAIVRRGAYDELVITTGEQLPFDADGPWRIQTTHRRAWAVWCQENAERFPPGGWYFDGAPIG